MMYSNVPVYARDVYGLGKLVDFLMPILQDVLEGKGLSSICFLRSLRFCLCR